MTNKHPKDALRDDESLLASGGKTHRLDDAEIENLSDLDLDEFVAEMGEDGLSPLSLDDGPDDVLGGAREVVHPNSGTASAEEKVIRLQDRLMRVAADFDNFRKRARRESEEAAHKSGQNVLRALLPVIDNLERALDVQGGNADPAATLDGVRMVLKQLATELRRIQVEPIETVGTEFDPQFHEAFEKVAAPGKVPGTIVTEYQKGYLFQNRLLRPALVSVASDESLDGDEKGVARKPMTKTTEVDESPEDDIATNEPFAALDDSSEATESSEKS